MKSNRIKAVLLFACGALLCAAVIGLWIGLSYVKGDDDHRSGATLGTIEMNVGEVYDLSDHFNADERGRVYLDVTNLDVSSPDVIANKASDAGVFLDGDGKLHAAETGVYNIQITVRYDEQLRQEVYRELLSMTVVVHDYEFGSYTPVCSYADLAQAGTEGGKYILAADFTVDREGEEARGFSGVLVNPNGYTITIADDQPLFSAIGSGSVVRGLQIKTDEDGIILGDGYAIGRSGNGVLASVLNRNGFVCDCTVEGTVYRGIGRDVCGFVLSNMGEIVRCTFRGTLFENGKFHFGITGNSVFGISIGGTVRDCAVYADAYRYGEKSITDAFTALHVSDTENKESLSGNRVFDLSGEHEVDLSERVEYVSFVGDEEYYDRADRWELFAGSVAEWSPNARNTIENAGAEVVSCALNGEEYPVQKLFVPSGRSKCTLELRGLYKETAVSVSSTRTLTVHAAEERVQLPEGTFATGIQMGEFSPKQVTLVFSPQTQTVGDTLFLESLYADVQLTVDISASEIYEERADGNVYRADSGKLCLYRGPVENGSVTIPDGVTEMSANPFGALEFTELYTNDLTTYENWVTESAYIVWFGEWMNSVECLRLGSALQFSELHFTFPRDFPALERIEAEPRSDGFAAEDGILYRDGDYYFVPPAYAAGGTLTLGAGNVLWHALYRNRAEEVVFGDGIINPYACDEAEFSSAVFAGETSVQSNAFYACNELLTVRAEPNASADLGEGGFYGCSALETIVLGEGFDFVAYDAVNGCLSFAGYELEDGCDKFTVSGGVLFVGGAAQLPAAWGGEDLAVPEGIADVRLYKDERVVKAEFRSVVLGQGVQSIRTEGVRFERYEVAAENPHLTAEDGLLFNKDMSNLIAWPAGKSATFYTLPESVASIAAYAFYGAEVLGIEGPGVVTVGEYAFADSALENAVFGDSLRTVGNHAFDDARHLQSIELGEGLLSVGDRAFQDASALQSVALPFGLEEIGDYAFLDSGLTEIVFPSASVSIGNGAFSGTEIASVILPEGMTQVPESLFSGAEMLTHVELPSTLESIGSYAFYNTALEQISLPAGLKSIGRYAFRGTELEDVALPAGLQSLGKYAFYGCEQLTSVTAANLDTVYEEGCFGGTPFLTEGRSAENGGIYLGNTLIALYGGGSTAEVRYGTKYILELRSDTVQVLKLPATVSAWSVTADNLPALRELWLGESPAEIGAELAVGDLSLGSFIEEPLLVHVPRHFRMEGQPWGHVRICYQGSAEDFVQYTHVPNFDEFYDWIYFFGAESGNRWHYGDGLQIVIEEGETDRFEYTYTYDSTSGTYECAVVGYTGTETSVTLPAYSAAGFPVTAVYDLGRRMSEVRIASEIIRFRGALETDRLYIPAECEVHTIVANGMSVGTLYLGSDAAFAIHDIDRIVVDLTVRKLSVFGMDTDLYYNGSPEEFAENAPVINVPVDAYYDEDGVYPSDGNAYWHFVDGEPVLWEESQA